MISHNLNCSKNVLKFESQKYLTISQIFHKRVTL